MTTLAIPAESVIDPAPVALLADDYCDRCGPSTLAIVAVLLKSGKLTFCGHHYKRHAKALAPLILGITP